MKFFLDLLNERDGWRRLEQGVRVFNTARNRVITIFGVFHAAIGDTNERVDIAGFKSKSSFLRFYAIF